MNEERKQVLDMLAAGKITADEADRLLTALEGGASASTAAGAGAASATATAESPKYIRIQADGTNRRDGGPVHINVRVPVKLLRAGVRLGNFIPPQAQQRINERLRERGVAFDVSQIKPENLDEVIDQLRDLTIDIDHHSPNGSTEDVKVKISAE